MKSVPPRGSGWVNAARSLPYGPTRYREVVLTSLCGVMISVLMLGTVPFAKQIGFDKAVFVGYTTMVLSFMMVFFGIRSYRENMGTLQLT